MSYTRKKRYATALDVDLKILQLKAKAQKELKQAEGFDADATIHRVKSNDESFTPGERQWHTDEMIAFRKRANQLRRHYHFLLEKKIPMLGRVKAKLQTQPMPFLEDKSVLEEEVK